jgi:selenocysteine lyase/cysteine desulfurase
LLRGQARGSLRKGRSTSESCKKIHRVDAVDLGAALDYVSEIGMENIAAYEHDLLNYGTAKLLAVPGLRLIGTAREKAGVMS